MPVGAYFLFRKQVVSDSWLFILMSAKESILWNLFFIKEPQTFSRTNFKYFQRILLTLVWPPEPVHSMPHQYYSC